MHAATWHNGQAALDVVKRLQDREVDPPEPWADDKPRLAIELSCERVSDSRSPLQQGFEGSNKLVLALRR